MLLFKFSKDSSEVWNGSDEESLKVSPYLMYTVFLLLLAILIIGRFPTE